nr:DNA/RNA nuclease SfsA [Spirochaetaceae bacterium]
MNYRGFFEKRINRFVVQLKLFHQKGETTRVYIPNPGRLWELLYPGTELLLKKNSSANKYNYSIEAVYKEGQLVYLHTLKNNDLAEHLLKNKRIPGLEEFHIIKREVKSPITTSRFDFLLEKQGQRCYLEVKSCSLFQGDMAMFPDAP